MLVSSFVPNKETVTSTEFEDLSTTINPKEERLIIQGKIKWAKVLGEPGWGFEKKHKEWSLDLYIDEEAAHKLEVQGLKDKIKIKGEDGMCVRFKRREFKSSGEANKPIRIVDDHGEPWPEDKQIGNGSVVNVNFAINEYGTNQRSANILSMQVWDHVPYGDGFETRKGDGSDAGESWVEDSKVEA